MDEKLLSRFKGAKISSLTGTRKEAEQKSGYTDWAKDYHNIEEGQNIFRIAPPHDPNDPPFQPFRTIYLNVDVPILDDDKNPTGKVERKKKRIFIATVHSDVMEGDIAEIYIDYVKKKANDEISDKEKRQSFLSPITGYRDSKKRWIPGISPSTNYMTYAWKNGKLGLLELYPVIEKKMEELNISEDSDEPIEIDCFSDPVDGVSLVIFYDKDSADSKNKYKVSKKEWDFAKYLKKFKDEKLALSEFQKDRKSEALTEEQLKELIGKKPLSSIYKNVYSKRDWDLVINGLMIFDTENKFGIFENEEFLKEMRDLEKQVPVKKEESKEDNAAESDEDDYRKWDREKLSGWIFNYVVEEEGVELDLSEVAQEDLSELMDKLINGVKVDYTPYIVPFKKDEDEPPKEEAPAANSNQALRDKLAKFKKA